MAVAKCPQCGMVQFDTGTGRCQDCNHEMETTCKHCGDHFILAPKQETCLKCQTPIGNMASSKGKPPPEEQEEPASLQAPKHRRKRKTQKIHQADSIASLRQRKEERVNPNKKEPPKRFSERSYRLLKVLLTSPSSIANDESPQARLLNALVKRYIDLELADPPLTSS